MFANIILADEINRTPPRTQAALLEAMQEYQVTVGGVRYPLERPLFVLATENPIEQEGTHPLPEAQLDRFMFNVVIDYPAVHDERRILAETTTGDAPAIRRVATGAVLERARTLVRDLPAADNVVDFALRLTRATRPADATAPAVGARMGEVGRRSARRPGTAARRQGRGADGRPQRAVARRHPRRRAARAAPSACSSISRPKPTASIRIR